MITFITGSAEKFREAQVVIPTLIRKDLDLPEIQELCQKRIIETKLRAAAELGLENIVVEDTGLYFSALSSQLPGPLIKWFVKTLGNDGLYSLAATYGNNKAFALTSIGYLKTPDSQPQFYEGKLEGSIVSARGSGFGWDAIFEPEGHSRTLAEFSVAEKCKISHRGKAFKHLLTALD